MPGIVISNVSSLPAATARSSRTRTSCSWPRTLKPRTAVGSSASWPPSFFATIVRTTSPGNALGSASFDEIIVRLADAAFRSAGIGAFSSPP